MLRRITGESGSNGDLDTAIDTIAALLRTLGRESFAVGELTVADIEKTFADAASTFVFGGRDFGNVRRLVLDHRKKESVFVSSSIADMREGFFSLASRFKLLLANDRESDSKMHAQLDRLGKVARNGDAAALRREVSTTIESLGALLDEKKLRADAELSALNRRVNELSVELDRAKKDSEIDALTKLYNRRAFNAELEKLSELRGQFRDSPALVLVDLDRFKSINDTFGHPAGDAVITACAKALLRCFSRQSDFVARYGGEELAVIVREATAENAKKHVANFLEILRKSPVTHDGRKISFTASAGVAMLGAKETTEAWIARADRALYEAKNAGRDRVVLAGEG